MSIYKYNICNGLSNQFLYHAGPIAVAVEQGFDEIHVPAYFIVNGVQTEFDDILPSEDNSVPFNLVFDEVFFASVISKLGIKVKFKRFDDWEDAPKCSGLTILEKAKPKLIHEILKAFQPSKYMSTLIGKVMDNLGDTSKSVCLHHRDGKDWYDHCARWGSIADGIYRGNCLLPEHETLGDSVRHRSPEGVNTIYYCGDHSIPSELPAHLNVVSHRNFLSHSDLTNILPNTEVDARDLWALVDYFVCRNIPVFIGNSVSTFSALQILIRNGQSTFWYNTGSIPLAMILKAYSVPLVYTYTELSTTSGKYLLKASISSALKIMPHNPIHMLYHGVLDVDFIQWLHESGVRVYNHNPLWIAEVEEMRKNGNAESSHLFLHAGNYLGTWQRIDIPLFLQSEYCLLVDSDTIFLRGFTLADFGFDLTRSIAMSSEFNPNDNIPSNAGVMFVNVPFMRKTYKQFIYFIRQGIESGGVYDHPSPSDQGAYLAFYNDTARFLIQRFNFKPYWDAQGPNFDNPFILHFHGAKPHDYLKFVFGRSCDKAIQILCIQAEKLPHLCEGFQAFAQYVPIDEYCLGSFSDIKEKRMCQHILGSIVQGSGDCSGSFSRFLLRNVATMGDTQYAQIPVSVSKDGVYCVSEYLWVGWQLFLTTMSLFCFLLGGIKLVFRTGNGKKYRPS